MAQQRELQDIFAQIFAAPSIERMLTDLSDDDFEDFVAYVFRQAGYIVDNTARQHGPGLDLRVYMGARSDTTLHAGVQVKHWNPDIKIPAPDVVHLRGGLPDVPGVTGYFVTTSTFKPPALQEAERGRRIWPIDGARFIRYINYIRGTRTFIADNRHDDDLSSLDHPIPPISPKAICIADVMVNQLTRTSHVLSLANHKGGVGKTTTALNLAYGLASQRYNRQVLLVDMDTQANLTRELLTPDDRPPHLGDYFSRKRSLAELVYPTRFPGVWLIPSDYDLTLADRGVSAGPGAELRFMRDLQAANITRPHLRNDEPFDWIIIDTGPSMGFFTRLALAASHFVLMPLSPGAFADTGDRLLRRTIAAMSALTGVEIKLLGGVVTQWGENALNHQLLAPVEHNLNLVGPKIRIDRNVDRLAIQIGQGGTRMLLDRATPAAQDYWALIDEVVRDVQSGR